MPGGRQLPLLSLLLFGLFFGATHAWFADYVEPQYWSLWSEEEGMYKWTNPDALILKKNHQFNPCLENETLSAAYVDVKVGTLYSVHPCKRFDQWTVEQPKCNLSCCNTYREPYRRGKMLVFVCHKDKYIGKPKITLNYKDSEFYDKKDVLHYFAAVNDTYTPLNAIGVPERIEIFHPLGWTRVEYQAHEPCPVRGLYRDCLLTSLVTNWPSMNFNHANPMEKLVASCKHDFEMVKQLYGIAATGRFTLISGLTYKRVDWHPGFTELPNVGYISNPDGLTIRAAGHGRLRFTVAGRRIEAWITVPTFRKEEPDLHPTFCYNDHNQAVRCMGTDIGVVPFPTGSEKSCYPAFETLVVYGKAFDGLSEAKTSARTQPVNSTVPAPGQTTLKPTLERDFLQFPGFRANFKDVDVL